MHLRVSVETKLWPPCPLVSGCYSELRDSGCLSPTMGSLSPNFGA